MSKLRCWPGCIAQIVRSRFPENVGALVHIIRFSSDASAVFGSPGWDAVALSSLLLADVMGRTGRTTAGEEGWARDADLRPITPPPGTVTDSEVRELFSPQPTRETV